VLVPDQAEQEQVVELELDLAEPAAEPDIHK